MKVLVTGVGGQLGHDVVNELLKRNYEVLATDLKDCNDWVAKPFCTYISLDITDEKAIAKAVSSIQPDNLY